MIDDSWYRFVKTGRVVDYLQYTACTSEEAMSKLKVENKKKRTEEKTSEGSNKHHRNRPVSNGNRRV